MFLFYFKDLKLPIKIQSTQYFPNGLFFLSFFTVYSFFRVQELSLVEQRELGDLLNYILMYAPKFQTTTCFLRLNFIAFLLAFKKLYFLQTSFLLFIFSALIFILCSLQLMFPKHEWIIPIQTLEFELKKNISNVRKRIQLSISSILWSCALV